ncbi:GspE/PulE family protein [Rubellicoccus peritrichatus]|uniref:GspE/PulE family protein n=1 Tax=Rubellicoccus peritrichatus TaxID=3080537 RepID=A0AAQ3L959_9BACT|nr:GspE/PulE family protein [Puniceicoccus sp. CR14]WOO41924.1 GspE/PulE family protein [Puniceicoccus sp. CR14]
MNFIGKIPAIDRLTSELSPEQEAAVSSASRATRLAALSDASGITERELLTIISGAGGYEVIDRIEPLDNAADILPLRIILNYQAVPIEAPAGYEGQLCLAVSWPPDEQMKRWIYAVGRREPAFFLTPADRINGYLTETYGVGSGSLDDPEVEAMLDRQEQPEEEEDENAAIIRFVNEVIAQAMRDRATDIHFEPRKDSLKIRYRIDGRLVPVSVPNNLVAFQSAIISRIKIMSRLNISERRRPQDGRITYGGGRDEVDVRVSTLPTMYGESVSMRLLSDQSQPTSIRDLGFLADDEETINRVLELPHGIALITGPTGSGKSTTLSAFMRRIGTPDRRVITVEDPIEYEIPEINQTQVNSEIGLSFANALRSVLRQDPDVIMVGEIRDRETADIAIRASLTGHLVLSTLHTNDAAGAITRLIDMEIEPFLISSSVELVIAQRLIRRLCHSCATRDDRDITQVTSCLVALDIPASEIKYAHGLKIPSGCEDCRGLGFRGRIGIYEILRVDESIHELINRSASAREIRERAMSRGMRSLQATGWEHAKHGLTALAEVMRYADMARDEAETTK